MAPESAIALSSPWTKQKTLSGDELTCDLAKSPKDDETDEDAGSTRWDVDAARQAEWIPQRIRRRRNVWESLMESLVGDGVKPPNGM